MPIEYDILNIFSPWSLGYCSCGCGKNLNNPFHGRHIRHKYLSGHNSKGINHPMWKGGRWKVLGYWKIYKPDYFSSTKDGYVREHIYVYQEHYQCCMLPWGNVHHINGIKDDNRIENLQGLMSSKHISLHHKGKKHTLGKHLIDTSNRFCYICNTITTRIDSYRYKEGVRPQPHWRHLPWDKINWYCSKCYKKEIRRLRKEGIKNV